MATALGMPERLHMLLQLIECPFCLNYSQDPRFLSCRHIYCYKCLKDYHEKGNHGNALCCSQRRDVTTLYQGWACLGVYPLDMPRTPYRASEGKRSQ